MIKSRELLEKEISRALEQKCSKRRELQRLIKEARETYDMPEKISSDFINMRRNLVEANTYTLFILTSILFGPSKLSEYFTKTEIKNLSAEKWYIPKVTFPLRFNMVRVNDDQYTGSITTKELMLLRDAQLINYNENAQRTMKHITKGETEYYQIALNKEAVRAIMESYESEQYIPNTITLNLPEDADFDYDERKKELVIHKANYLDILDGYHRYIAMSKAYSKDPSFEQKMELRIVQFPEGKAKRFIWQEDQKTKMRKIDSDSMNTTKASNKIVERLNNDPNFVLSGKISRNKGIINAAYFSDIINTVLLKGTKKSEELSNVLRYTNVLANDIERWCSLHSEYLTTAWEKKFIYAFVYVNKYGSLDELLKDYKKIAKDESIYSGPSLTSADITRTHKLLGKEDY